MIPALGERLNRHDAECDKHAIYMGNDPIIQRPYSLSIEDWYKICRFVCGKVPVVDHLEASLMPVDDPACWARLEAYMAPHEAAMEDEAKRLRAQFTRKR